MSKRRSRGNRIHDQAFAAVIKSFMHSPKWQGYSRSTQDTWARELRFAEDPGNLGALSVFEIRPALVQAFIDGLTGRPGKQAAALGALRQLEKWAIVRDLLPHPICTGIEYERSHDGHKPWSEDQVHLAELHARPELSRVITLAANTGQRGSDLVRMRWTDLETYNGREGINVTQQKTGKQLWIPITRELGAAMSTWERRPGYILLRPTGIPWSRKALSWAWECERKSKPALGPVGDMVLHGLRASACVRLLRAGANTRQIADMVGMSEEIVGRYCRFSVQRENASAAVLYLDRTFGERSGSVSSRTHK